MITIIIIFDLVEYSHSLSALTAYFVI